MRRILTEPLLHFLLVGAVLFAASSLRRDDRRPEAGEIRVSSGKITHLSTLFTRTWQRPPTQAELKGLIDDYVQEEIAYREGLALGLDRNDTIIRRRLRQKLEFVAEDLATLDEPTDAELAEHLRTHPDQFRSDDRLSFRHVYLSPERRGESLEDEARELLRRLDEDPSIDARDLGDRILLEHGYADVSSREIAALFGGAFASAVRELEEGAWHGPIESGYGAHLVRVDARSEGRLPALDEVRNRVRREWASARRIEAIDAFYAGLLERYDVVIEWPDPDPGDEG